MRHHQAATGGRVSLSRGGGIELSPLTFLQLFLGSAFVPLTHSLRGLLGALALSPAAGLRSPIGRQEAIGECSAGKYEGLKPQTPDITIYLWPLGERALSLLPAALGWA